MRLVLRLIARVLLLSIAAACTGTTGGDVVSFRASAAGVAGASDFTNGLGYHVALSRARLLIGAVYLNQNVPTSGAQGTSCTLPGTYVAEAFGPLEVDALATQLQPFRSEGEGIALSARSAELWLAPGAIDAVDDTGVILDAAGMADKDGTEFPFEAALTIAENRLIPAPDPASPGAHPICRQRIVSPLPVDITPRDTGQLIVRVDARAFFRNVDFSTLEQAVSDPPLYRFADSAATQADVELFDYGLRSQAAYEVSWK